MITQYQFKETPVCKKSISSRKLVYGRGINDAEYHTSTKINGKRYYCPFYRRWKGMLERCYCDTLSKRLPTYKDCLTCDDWLIFTNFKKWMIDQDWKGNHLDKDLIKFGNKLYSPETCIFVSPQINSLITSRKSKGVSSAHQCSKFQARCGKGGKIFHLGLFDLEEDARKAYVEFKTKSIIETAERQTEPLRSILMARALIWSS